MEGEKGPEVTVTTESQADLYAKKVVAEEEEEKQSALMASIKKFGTNAYYYAHAPKNYNIDGAEVFKADGLIYGGEPTLLGQRQAQAVDQKQLPIKKITKYSWVDEDSKVKIYIDLKQFKGDISHEMLEVKIEENSCLIKVVDEDAQQHVLNLTKLYEKVEPEKSSHRVRSNRLTITLHKWLETSWKELSRDK